MMVLIVKISMQRRDGMHFTFCTHFPLYMSTYISYLYVYIFIYLSMLLSIYLSFYLSLCMYTYIYIDIQYMIEYQLYTHIWRFPGIGGPPHHPDLTGFSIVNHPFLGTPILGNLSLYIYIFIYLFLYIYIYIYIHHICRDLFTGYKLQSVPRQVRAGCPPGSYAAATNWTRPVECVLCQAGREDGIKRGDQQKYNNNDEKTCRNNDDNNNSKHYKHK